METPATPRVWFKSISLENVRSFGTKQTIYFTEDGTENGNAARWNVILGDNGTGKTTVLNSLLIQGFLIKVARGGRSPTFVVTTKQKHDYDSLPG